MSDLDSPVLFQDVLRDENTGVTYTPATFENALGYVVTHPDGRKECLILHPSGWHDINARDSQGDTFIYRMNTDEVAEWERNCADPDAEPLDWWHFVGAPVTYVNHFENESEVPA